MHYENRETNMTHDVFISYSRKDTAIADKICAALDKQGITYFIDRKGIGGGMEFPSVIAEAIINCKIILFLGSANSYQSKFTNSEVTFAFNEKEPGSIIPYIIDNSSLPAALRFTFSSINIRTIQEHPIETILMQDLCQILGRKFVEEKNLDTANRKENKKDTIVEGKQEEKAADEVDSRGCFAIFFIIVAIGFLAAWFGNKYHSYWVAAGVFLSLSFIAFWSWVQWDEYIKLPNIKDKGKREKKRTAIIRDLICVDLVGVFFGVAVAVGLWQHSFWLGLVTWIVPSFVSIFYTAEKDDDLTS